MCIRDYDMILDTNQIDASEFLETWKVSVQTQAAQCGSNAARSQCARRIQCKLVICNKRKKLSLYIPSSKASIIVQEPVLDRPSYFNNR